MIICCKDYALSFRSHQSYGVGVGRFSQKRMPPRQGQPGEKSAPVVPIGTVMLEMEYNGFRAVSCIAEFQVS